MPTGIYKHKGHPLSEATKQKVSDNHAKFWLGKHRSEEIKQKISETLKGHLTSEETRKKISEANNGKVSPNKGIPMSEEQKKKMSKIQKGASNSNWKGGISPLRQRIYSNFKSRQWRSDIFTRDNFTCQECGQRGEDLNAHHIKSFSSILQKYEITTLEEALECEELWNINNGVTLCKECHKKIHMLNNSSMKRGD